MAEDSENNNLSGEANKFSGQALADSLASHSKAPETQTTPPLEKADSTRQKLIEAGVEDKFGQINLPQPDGKTPSLLRSNEYQVLRSDGRIEDGWQTLIVGENIIMTKSDENGHEIHKTMSYKDWFIMQAKIQASAKHIANEPQAESLTNQQSKPELDSEQQRFEQYFDGLMIDSMIAIDMADQSPIKELTVEQAKPVVDFGRVKLSLKDLIESPKVAEEIYNLRKSEKNGRRSQDVVRELVETIKNDQYDEAKEQDPISVSLVRLENGKTAYNLNGGRHRIAAMAIAGRQEIEVDLTTLQGYLDSDLKQVFTDRQVHSDIADRKRENTIRYNPDVRVI